MTEDEWLTSDDPRRMFAEVITPHLKRTGRFTHSRQRDLFCVACCRLLSHLLLDEKCMQAVEWLEANAGRGWPKIDDVDFEECEEHGLNMKVAAEDGGGTLAQTMAAYVADDLWCGEVDIPLFHFQDGTFKGELPNEIPSFLASLLRDIFGNPFRGVAFDPEWRSDTAVSLAKQMYESRDFSTMPILADAHPRCRLRQ
ncbi:MAG: hypothetical protein U0792_18110 [Gemmataceae bacterium]